VLVTFSGDHLDILVWNVPRLLHGGLLRHVVLLLIVHWVRIPVQMLHILHGWSYKIILHNFLNVHSWLRNKLLLLWEHVVVLGSELGGDLRLRLDNLLFLLDYLAFDILQAILDQVSF
jgi:hypothetical protein